MPTTADGAEKRVFLMNTLTGRTMVCVAPTIVADPGRGGNPCITEKDFSYTIQLIFVCACFYLFYVYLEDGGYETHTTSSSSPIPGGLSRIVMSPPLAGTCKILNLRRHNYTPSRKKQG